MKLYNDNKELIIGRIINSITIVMNETGSEIEGTGMGETELGNIHIRLISGYEN